MSQWTEYYDGIGVSGSWKIQDGKLYSYANSQEHTFLCVNNKLPRNYIFKSKVRNISGVDQQYIFRSSVNRDDYYLVDFRYNDSLWSWDNNDIRLYRIYPNSFRLIARYPGSNISNRIDITQSVEHDISVSLEENKIKVYFDNALVINAVDESDILLEGGMCLMTWGGDYPEISENIFDNVSIVDDFVVRNKIIFLPGLGASWNMEAMINGDSNDRYKWKMTPFVKNYDGLIAGFKNNGLIENKDFYVWNYDWRKPLPQIVEDFNKYINSLNLEENEKVNLVGHSLGGLTARIWGQDHLNKIGRIYTFGSPHYGSVKAYEVWNGLKTNNKFDFGDIGLSVYVQLQKKNFDNQIQTLRKMTPIIFDLIPSFDFLKKNDNMVKTASSNYVREKNNQLPEILTSLMTFDGIGVETKEWISLGERNLMDKVLGIWEEGRPIDYIYGEGDGTVLKKSALIEGALSFELNSEHGDLMSEGKEKLFEEMGLGGVSRLKNFSGVEKEVNKVFYISGPVMATIDCGEGEMIPNEGWLLTWTQENCRVKMEGQESANYYLVIGNDEGWSYFEGKLKSGEEKTIYEKNSLNNWEKLEIQAKQLNAQKMLETIKKRDLKMTVEEYMKFRDKEKIFKYSEEILEELKNLLNESQPHRGEINGSRGRYQGKKAWVETRIKLWEKKKILPAYEKAINYQQAEEIAEDKSYGGYYLAGRLLDLVK